MNLKEIQTRITGLNDALIDKDYTVPDCDLTILGSGDVSVWVKCGHYGKDGRVFEGLEGATIGAALEAADKFIADLESMSDYKKKEAVKSFGRAVDGLRAAGIEAKFVDPLSDTLKAMSENLLVHQPETSA